MTAGAAAPASAGRTARAWLVASAWAAVAGTTTAAAFVARSGGLGASDLLAFAGVMLGLGGVAAWASLALVGALARSSGLVRDGVGLVVGVAVAALALTNASVFAGPWLARFSFPPGHGALLAGAVAGAVAVRRLAASASGAGARLGALAAERVTAIRVVPLAVALAFLDTLAPAPAASGATWQFIGARLHPPDPAAVAPLRVWDGGPAAALRDPELLAALADAGARGALEAQSRIAEGEAAEQALVAVLREPLTAAITLPVLDAPRVVYLQTELGMIVLPEGAPATGRSITFRPAPDAPLHAVQFVLELGDGSVATGLAADLTPLPASR